MWKHKMISASKSSWKWKGNRASLMMLQRSNARSEIIVAFVEEVAANMVADDVHIFLDLVPECLVYL